MTSLGPISFAATTKAPTTWASTISNGQVWVHTVTITQNCQSHRNHEPHEWGQGGCFQCLGRFVFRTIVDVEDYLAS